MDASPSSQSEGQHNKSYFRSKSLSFSNAFKQFGLTPSDSPRILEINLFPQSPSNSHLSIYTDKFGEEAAFGSPVHTPINLAALDLCLTPEPSNSTMTTNPLSIASPLSSRSLSLDDTENQVRASMERSCAQRKFHDNLTIDDNLNVNTSPAKAKNGNSWARKLFRKL